MPLKEITLHEGFNDLGNTEINITNVETPLSTSTTGTTQNQPIPSRNLLFQVKFKPSGHPVPSEYTLKFDFPPLNTITQIEGEVIGFGGENTYGFTLTETPVKAGSLSITDGEETFTDNGDGTLRGSEGGSATINYNTGAGSVTFFTPPNVGTDIVANYLIHTVITDENLGEATGITQYNFILAHTDVIPGTVTISIDGTDIVDNGTGGLDGTNWTGTINYITGAIALQFVGLSPPASGSFLADYTYWGAATPEVVDEGELTTNFDFALVHHPIIADTLQITDGTEIFADNGDGTLTGDQGGTGTINYVAGTGTLIFNTAPSWAIPIFADYNTANEISEGHTNGQGYVQMDTPVYPIVTVKTEGQPTIIDYQVVGTLEDRQDEFYIRLDDNGSGLGPYYSLITDIYVKDGFLKIFDGDATYYKIMPEIPVAGGIAAIKISDKGQIAGYDATIEDWVNISTLEFNSIESPQNLNIVSDGIYAVSGTIGAITTGTLGEPSTVFEHFIGRVNNPEPYFINIGVSVFEPEADRPVKMADFAHVMQGSMNLQIIEVTADPYVAPDLSPSLMEIQSISGVTFTNPFLAFLNEKGLTTLEKVRLAGPLTYVNGYPGGVNPNQLKVLQGHTDLYSINQNAAQNQIIIDGGYPSLFKIANTPKNVFLEDVLVDPSLPLFKAAQIHEVTVQNMRLVANTLTNTLTDARMVNSVVPLVEDSTFAESAFAKATSSCGCDDCTSMISPFAYLMDLLKYGSEHLTYKVGTTTIYSPTNFSTYVTLIEGLFYQPFGTMDVDCETLHDEYCRVRLVTEVLEQVVAATTLSPTKSTALTTERNQFFTLVYQTLLVQAGTSINEVRDVYNKQPTEVKLEAVKKLADKLRIPVYFPSTTFFTTDILWLTIGNSILSHELTAANLELIFGFRDTKRNVLTPTPVSYMEIWRAAYLRDKWKAEDYLLSEFSREGVVVGTPASYKANWKPIIDPDNMGWEDLSYNNYSYPRDIWNQRKINTDDFLYSFINPASTVTTSMTAIDLKKLILRVSGVDMVSHVLENNEIEIWDGSNWQNFKVIGRSLNGINTDVVLDKAAYGSIFQPQETTPGAGPKLRYKRVVSVAPSDFTSANPNSFNIKWTDNVIENVAPGSPYAKLSSSAVFPANSPYETTGATFTITTFSVVNIDEVQLVLNNTGADGAFRSPTSTIEFTYEVEVPLYFNIILDPGLDPLVNNKTVNELFTTTQNYTLLAPVPAGLTSPFPYEVWLDPVTWPSGLTEPNDYYKLKTLYKLLVSGKATEAQKAIISDNLRLNTDEFTRMMLLLIKCEDYLLSMYTAPEPSKEEIHELVSFFRTSAKTWLRLIWIQEEIEHLNGVTPIKLSLDSQYFVKPIDEPESGIWDSSLQTIPAIVGDINSLIHTPIIEPDLVALNDLNTNPEAQKYRDLLTSRQAAMVTTRNDMRNLLSPYDSTGYEKALNFINTDNTATPYNILPYTLLQDLIDDLNSNNPFLHKKAADVAWVAFRINAEDFSYLANIKALYEDPDPIEPSEAEIEKTVVILAGGYKRLQHYGTPARGWLRQEVLGTYISPNVPIVYYNALQLKMAPGRSDVTYREQWQKTLEAWNRLATIQPDIVPPQNIKNFVSTNWVYTTWNSRRTSLLSTYSNVFALVNPASVNSNVMYSNLQNILSTIVSRGSNPAALSGTNYLSYFLNVAEVEAEGNDIRPLLSLYDISIAEYRVLANVYKILEDENTPAPLPAPTSLLLSECEDVANIIVAINSRYTPFLQVVEEYTNNLILDQDYFQIYKASPDTFPLTDLPEFNKWRAPLSLRRKWTSTLQTRIDQEKAAKEKWKDVLMEAEDRNMPFMRDALIRALMQECETLDEAADRLAKTYFIETKDNCCVKHTRVSFAIETLQGLYWALETGVFDDFIGNFSLSDVDFKERWKWLGSYATWRSAMFVFLYPENLLYPTLKRLQSPIFRKLVAKVQDAGRFSPDDACVTAHEFQNYLDDIENLEIICSTTADTLIKNNNAIGCCETSTTPTSVYSTFFFGQNPKSGKSYWSFKPGDDNTVNALNFWEELPIPSTAKLVSCFVLADRTMPAWTVENLALWLFYSFTKEGKLKLAYYKKDLTKPDSVWLAGDEIDDLPNIPIGSSVYRPSRFYACQQGAEWANPNFFIECTNQYGWSQYFSAIFLKNENKIIFPQYTGSSSLGSGLPPYSSYNHDVTNDEPISCIKIILNNGAALLYNCMVYVTVNYVSVRAVGVSVSNEKTIPFTTYGKKIVGAFESREEANTLIVLYEDYTSKRQAKKLKFGFSMASLSGAVTLSLTSITSLTGSIWADVSKVYPYHTQYSWFGFAAVKMKNTSGNTIIAGLFSSPTGDMDLHFKNEFALKPESIAPVLVESADCTEQTSTGMDTRTVNIMKKLQENITQQTTPLTLQIIIKPTVIRELLYEAYYFFPMLLALDQQRRGQFDSALSWYRSIYDYTNSLVAKRKIFYGLVLEETITSTYSYTSNWLLDPLNPHFVAQTRTNAYTKYTLMNIIQCMYGYADREFTIDTIETVPRARKLYASALELLKVPELEFKINECIAMSEACIDTSTEIFTSRVWAGLLDDVKEKLAALSDKGLIESMAHEIAEILNSGDENTYAAKFAEVFELIEENTPEPPAIDTIADRMAYLKSDADNAARYLAALNNPSNFNAIAGEMYATNTARICSINVNEINSELSEEKLLWLKEPDPKNTANYTFSFTNDTGVQNLSGNRSYNPFSPTQDSYSANLLYANAKASSEADPVGPPTADPYTPLITFKFCMPTNPIYNALILKGNLELFKIFNCRNIAGMVRELDVFAADTDSTTGVPVIGASGNLVLPGVNNFSPTQYRFRVLLERARQIAQQAQQLESLFLAALEKEDAENYAQLRARQDLETAKATIKLQDLRIRQANSEKSLANLQLDKVIFIQSHYEELIAAGLNEFEIKSLDQLKFSAIFQGISAVFSVLSSVTAGNEGPKNGFSLITANLATASTATANIFSTLSSINTQLASFARRTEEWQYQSDLAGQDIGIANQQIKIADDNIRIVGQEREIAVMNTDHAEDALNFLKNKFTNAELYNWMGRVLESAYSYMLNLSTATARTAESQLYFERQEQAGPFILDDYWELPSSGFTSGTSAGQTDRRGLTGSARLLVDIQRLDQHAFETNKRKLQMTKVISLAQNFPSEFQQFKETGVMNFELTNRFFDYDFPGHYLRLVNTVRTTVVGLLPVYDSIKATLTAEPTSYTVIGGTTFQKIPIKRLNVESVALTSANNATGVFELQPIQNQELLNPFEGMGIESRWEFKMPQFTNRMDFANIADVLITVEYTALDNFQYRYEVLQELNNELSFNRGFSLRNNFPDQWYELAQAVEGDDTFEVSFELKREFFPQGIENLQLNGTDLVLFFARADDFEGEIQGVVFNYESVSVTVTSGDTTSEGKLSLAPVGDSPLTTLKLVFDNTPENRELFTDEKVKDILLLVGCKAELKSYPL